MNTAEEIFSRVPKKHNCAQSVAAGLGRDDLTAELASCGGGNAPEGRCGALHAALLLTPPESHEKVRAAFRETAGSEFCRELKQIYHFPCARCVALAAELAEQSGK